MMGHAILIHGSPEVMPLTVDLDEDSINVESVAIAAMLFLQLSDIHSTKLDAPESDRLSSYFYSTLSENILDITMT